MAGKAAKDQGRAQDDGKAVALLVNECAVLVNQNSFTVTSTAWLFLGNAI